MVAPACQAVSSGKPHGPLARLTGRAGAPQAPGVRLPLIGLTAGGDPKRPEVYQLRQDYVRSVERARGIPVALVPGGPRLTSGNSSASGTSGTPGASGASALSAFSALVDRLDGLVVTGGVDVAPALYGQSPHPTVLGVSDERDGFELLLLREAIRRDLPLLGICRGMQVLNVALGGTLIQDIPSAIGSKVAHDDPARERDQLAHDVEVDDGSRLARLLGSGQLAVNSFHHQAVDRLGEGLVATAYAPDGIVEGVEIPSARHVVAVQWHPESFWRDFDRFGPLFVSLVRAASGEKG